ncbi:hypothetical protein M9Y10_036253 [Tritrichomonas musculus]|uniref:Uncharacterized protein n=1 Tax=Tritrichomonas musculus TaxID=1915356 RepID=A0ABR2GUV9_9EUKA
MAGGASWGSVLSTLVSYLQKLGLTVSLDGLNIPPKLKEVLVSIYLFYEKIQNAIPQLPDFDLRSQLMVLALAIPFLLDVLLVWFINPIGVTMTHVLDLIAFGVGTYFITSSIIGSWSLFNISIIAICVVFIALRIIFLFLTKQKDDFELYVLVDEICNYYMQGILPSKKCELSFKDLNISIHKFSQIIEIAPPKANLLVSYAFLFVSFAFFFLSFWCLDAFPIPYDFPEIITLLLPIFGIPLGVIFFVIYVLRLFHCGRYFLTLVKQFIRRWGLRILMMVLDLLYIPILTVLITMITPTYISCPKDEYLYYQVKDTDIPWFPFINHTASCRPCIDHELRSNFCDKKCSGMGELRMKQAPDLLFVNDIIIMTGGLILYTIVIVMLGLPWLWYYITKRNHKYIDRINVYGKTEEIKYGAIIHRLNSTGVFLFQDYKSKFAIWSVVLLGLKFVLMVLTVCQEIFSNNLIYVYPVYYGFTFGIHVYLKPYLYPFNTFFESSMEFMEAIFSIFAIITYSGVNIPEAVSFPISILMLIFPVFSVLFILCCEGKEGTKKDKSDPTIIRKADTKDVKEHRHIHISKNEKSKNEDEIDKKKKNKYFSRFKQIKRKVVSSGYESLVEVEAGILHPVESGARLPDFKQDYYKPNTSRAHNHPNGHNSRPATPLITVSGVPSHYPTRPQTAQIYNTDSDYDDSDSYSLMDDISSNVNIYKSSKHRKTKGLNSEVDMMSNGQREKKKKKNRHHHFHDQQRIEIDSDGEEHVVGNIVEIEDGMLDSILELRRKNEEYALDGLQVKECFTIKKKTAARRMTKMYKTLDVVLDGSTIDKLTTILNNAVIVGVIAVGWYLGTLMTSYQYSSNFTCG